MVDDARAKINEFIEKLLNIVKRKMAERGESTETESLLSVRHNPAREGSGEKDWLAASQGLEKNRETVLLARSPVPAVHRTHAETVDKEGSFSTLDERIKKIFLNSTTLKVLGTSGTIFAAWKAASFCKEVLRENESLKSQVRETVFIPYAKLVREIARDTGKSVTVMLPFVVVFELEAVCFTRLMCSQVKCRQLTQQIDEIIKTEYTNGSMGRIVEIHEEIKKIKNDAEKLIFGEYFEKTRVKEQEHPNTKETLIEKINENEKDLGLTYYNRIPSWELNMGPSVMDFENTTGTKTITGNQKESPKFAEFLGLVLKASQVAACIQHLSRIKETVEKSNLRDENLVKQYMTEMEKIRQMAGTLPLFMGNTTKNDEYTKKRIIIRKQLLGGP
jgi:hypothetical protein